MSAQRRRLPTGCWHFQHGPIDLIIGGDGDAVAIDAACDAAWLRFTGVLDELVAELPLLRRPIETGPCLLRGVVARRMWHACAPFREHYVTPMAAVAGSVAEELISHLMREGIDRAWINNGGDIALHLTKGSSVRIGLVADVSAVDPQHTIDAACTDGQLLVTSVMPVRGIATSGWRGRSFSRGIADSVTVLARTAAQADAAATIIANAVDIDDPRIVRRPACELKDDSDLGQLLVTVEVPPLGAALAMQALLAGRQCASDLKARGLIHGAVLVCQGVRLIDDQAPRQIAQTRAPTVTAQELPIPELVLP